MKTLDPKQQAMIPIAAFTSTGKLDKLKGAINEGLVAGLTINEIKEIIVQMYAYSGFPRSLNGLSTFLDVLKEREGKGIKDEIGKEASPLSDEKTVLDRGTEVQTYLIGAPAKGPVYDFAPVIDFYLKDHLFGDIFGRDVLDFKSREIVTISALASMERTENQLRGHLNVSLNIGLTESQLREFISVLEKKVGKKEAEKATAVLNSIVSSDASSPKMVIDEGEDIKVVHKDAWKSVKAAPQNFTGRADVEYLSFGYKESNISNGIVTFQPGARTNWHTHPKGQMLIVTKGKGRVQQWGKPIQDIAEGDVVWFPPGVKHWHGAAPDSVMAHIAIAEIVDGKAADWMEKVTDEQYVQ